MSNSRILFVTSHYPPNNTGAAVVMKNLIDGLNKKTIAGIVTQSNSFADAYISSHDSNIYYLFKYLNLIDKRFWHYGRKLLFKFELKKLCRIILKTKTTHVVGVYPDLDFLELARSAAELTNTKFYPYLHDTIVEGLSHKIQAKKAKIVQEKIFKNKNAIFVMSEGMKELYYNKYGLVTVPLLHSFIETAVLKYQKSNLEKKSIFWGGSIYNVNKESVKRVYKACSNSNIGLLVSAANEYDKLEKLGFKRDNITISPFLSRDDYIKQLQKQTALLLAIDWPDEAPLHIDELSTIFPTKTIEYLLSGRPIIVHCPEDYFLAKFFKKYDCGFVICDRDVKHIEAKIKEVLSNEEEIKKKVHNAFVASEQFKIKEIVKIFEREVLLSGS